MCGLAGIVLQKPGSIQRSWLEGFLSRLAHRGPDDQGILWLGMGEVRVAKEPLESRDGQVALVHRRLSILDLTESGWQPMGTPDGRYYVVFNGEIYNFVELRAELQGIGHIFHTRSDTEVLLGAWRAWGPSSLRRFVGMFAFALLDTVEGRLHLVRDPFGIKPLYYTLLPEGLGFASEIPPLLGFPGVSREIHPGRLYQYLRFGLTDHGEETLFAHIRQIPAGHYLEVPLHDPHRARLLPYYRFELQEPLGLPFKEAATTLRELFLENVRLHLRSDVPVGAALSGGVDSSSIVMAMRHLEPDLEIHAFSFVAEDQEVSEERYVDIVAQAARVFLHKVRIVPGELLFDLPTLIRAQGEPFGSTSIYAQYRVFQRARAEGIKVMLDGQGADELLGGYVGYGAARVASLIARGQVPEGVGLLLRLSRLPGRGRVWKSVIGRLLPLSLEPLARRVGGESLLPPWLNESWFRERGVNPLPPSRLAGFLRDRLRSELLETLTETSLPMLLRYEDRDSMAHSLESRVPFLTVQLAEFILQLPEEYIIGPDGESKRVFRRAMQGLVPDPILERKDKIGFATPERRWLRELAPWVERELKGDLPPPLVPRALWQEWEGILGGKRPFDFRVWRWINLVQWARAFEVVFP